ncbi:MAG TPA: S9 family peptidase, partial [Anaerolineales bacterium]|nr:S9 family peptidase [Anaerolineales bacterium]
MARIESLLSARLFVVPQLVGDRLFFLSNLSGRISLYGMDYGGSVPEPLLPPHIALQNPELIGGFSFYVFPKIEKILIMIDRDGDENYQPMVIPIKGGFPEPAFGDKFNEYRVHLGECDADRNVAYLAAESRKEQSIESYQAQLENSLLIDLGKSPWGNYPDGANEDHSKVILSDEYTVGDNVLYLWERGQGERQLLYGIPREKRETGEEIPLNAIHSCQFTQGGGLLFSTALFSDTYGLGYLDLHRPDQVAPVAITNIAHQGLGEFEDLKHLKDHRYLLQFNIDGSSWLYEGTFDEEALTMELEAVICGQAELSQGVLES